MTRKARSPQALRRRAPFQPPRESILIVCEGRKTEPNYFKGWVQKLRVNPLVEVRVHGEARGSAPISVVDYAITLRNEKVLAAKTSPVERPFDVVWCVMDVEVPPHTSLAQAYNKALANDLKISLSNPCFEYWYLLHFKRTSALFCAAAHVIRALKHYHPAYTKNDPDFFDVVYPRTDTAINNSKGVLAEKHYGEDLRTCNPSTHVHRVVEHLRAAAAKPFDPVA